MHDYDQRSDELTEHDFATIKHSASRHAYPNGEVIFAEGAAADFMYFIESGRVSVRIQEFTRQREISTLGPGEYFGEMAFFMGDKRSASVVAVEDSALLRIDRDSFERLLRSEPQIADKINRMLAQRDEELALKETLLERTGIACKNLHIGIKGDPSLRESAFFRERYESVVDKFLPVLQPQLLDLLLNRSVYEIFIHFNSGELQIRSVFDPFNDEVHPAEKLTNKAYVQRHFQPMAYAEKAQLVKRIFEFLCTTPEFGRLSPRLGEDLRQGFRNWSPVSPQDLTNTLSRLSLLRRVPNFYLRNFSVSMIRDAIRMQFNCDGAHIISADGYQTFLQQNLPVEEEEIKPQQERRRAQRRTPGEQVKVGGLHAERRTPPGRRQEDWDAFNAQVTDTTLN